jgi:hypothetical protein
MQSRRRHAEGNAVREDLLRTLTDVRLDGQPLQLEPSPDASFVATSIALVDEDATVDTVFEVIFRDVPALEEDGETFLVVTWVMFPPNEVTPGAARSPELLALINTANAEPGAKIRVEVDGDSEVVLCETDVPALDVSVPAVEAALARSRDVLALHFDALEPLVRGR